jgi:hypothetical protein
MGLSRVRFRLEGSVRGGATPPRMFPVLCREAFDGFER